MEIRVEAGDITKTETPALVVNLFQGVTNPKGATGTVDKALGGVISQLIQEREIKGRLGEITLIHTMGKIAASRVLVAGLGKADDFDEHTVRRVSGDVVRYLRQRSITRLATIAGWCWLRQMGAGPMRMLLVSRIAAAMKISGLTMFSYAIVWCSPIQNSLKPISSVRTISSMSSS